MQLPTPNAPTPTRRLGAGSCQLSFGDAPHGDLEHRQAEHPARTDAPVLFGELREKPAKVGAERTRHEAELYLAAKMDHPCGASCAVWRSFSSSCSRRPPPSSCGAAPPLRAGFPRPTAGGEGPGGGRPAR